MFERVTGFFRRFRSKRKTSETAVLGPDEAGFDDFGLDDADFGDTIGTEEFGGSLDAADSGGDDLGDDFDLGGDEGFDSLSGVDTFETLGEGQQAGSLAGGSGESLLEDSQGQLDTFESIPGFDSGPGSGDSDSGGLEEGFEDFGTGFDDMAGGAEPEEFGEELPAAAGEAARIGFGVIAGSAVGGIVLGVLITFVLPLISASTEGPPVEQLLQKAQSDVRRAQSDLNNYQKLGGLAAIEQLKSDLAASQAEFATVEELEAAVEEARQREQVYDAIVAATQEAERTRAEHAAAREALVAEIRREKAQLAEQRTVLEAALADHQRIRRAMEASAVVADAFDAADLTYTQDRVAAMAAPASPDTMGE